jgi:hypothetical protein
MYSYDELMQCLLLFDVCCDGCICMWYNNFEELHAHVYMYIYICIYICIYIYIVYIYIIQLGAFAI